VTLGSSNTGLSIIPPAPWWTHKADVNLKSRRQFDSSKPPRRLVPQENATAEALGTKLINHETSAHREVYSRESEEFINILKIASAQFAVILVQCGRRSSQQKPDIDLKFGAEVKGAGPRSRALASPARRDRRLSFPIELRARSIPLSRLATFERFSFISANCADCANDISSNNMSSVARLQ
jgi:hypothetical protein